MNVSNSSLKDSTFSLLILLYHLIVKYLSYLSIKYKIVKKCNLQCGLYKNNKNLLNILLEIKFNHIIHIVLNASKISKITVKSNLKCIDLSNLEILYL